MSMVGYLCTAVVLLLVVTACVINDTTFAYSHILLFIFHPVWRSSAKSRHLSRHLSDNFTKLFQYRTSFKEHS